MAGLHLSRAAVLGTAQLARLSDDDDSPAEPGRRLSHLVLRVRRSVGDRMTGATRLTRAVGSNIAETLRMENLQRVIRMHEVCRHPNTRCQLQALRIVRVCHKLRRLRVAARVGPVRSTRGAGQPEGARAAGSDRQLSVDMGTPAADSIHSLYRTRDSLQL
eukprot:3028019-Prymnesium_polylepis.1